MAAHSNLGLEKLLKHVLKADECPYDYSKAKLVKRRKTNAADHSIRTNICTKRYLGHPTLLPGIVSLYCKHGKYKIL